MTDKEIDEAINAEVHEAIDFVWNDKWKHWERRSAWGNRTIAKRIWHYTSDLNLMHEVEALLSEDQLLEMTRWIERLAPDQFYFRVNARLRAEAYLRTIKKWKWA